MAAPHTNKQWYWPGAVNGWQNLQQRTVPVPQPGPGQVLVRIHAVSLNFRDLLIARNQAGGEPLEDLVPLSDVAGEVVVSGSSDSALAPGDRVIAGIFEDDAGGAITPEVFKTGLGLQRHGTLQQYRVFPEAQLVKFPAHMSYEEAATLVGAVTGYRGCYLA